MAWCRPANLYPGPSEARKHAAPLVWHSQTCKNCRFCRMQNTQFNTPTPAPTAMNAAIREGASTKPHGSLHKHPKEQYTESHLQIHRSPGLLHSTVLPSPPTAKSAP
jgi:hypothetical protein